MNKQISPFQKKSFNDFMNVENGVEFWYARDIMNLFGYQTWQKFKDSIERAKTACEMSGNIVLEHFLPAPVKTSGASGRPSENYKLTRYACYLIAQNTDQKEVYFKQRGIDDDYCKKIILDYLEKFGSAKKRDFETILLDKLPDALNDRQKKNKVTNNLQALRRDGKIKVTQRNWSLN